MTAALSTRREARASSNFTIEVPWRGSDKVLVGHVESMETTANATLPLPDMDALFGLNVSGPVTVAELLIHFAEPPEDIVGAARLVDGRLFVAYRRGSVILPARPDPKQTALALHAARIARRAVRLDVN